MADKTTAADDFRKMPTDTKLEVEPCVVPKIELRIEERAMPAFLPILFTGSYLVMAANEVPKLNYTPSCKAAARTGLAERDEDACKRDEEAARDKLNEEWSGFNAEQRRHCLALTTLGGPPSYVELLTCLEMARDAAKVKTFLKPTEKVEE